MRRNNENDREVKMTFFSSIVTLSILFSNVQFTNASPVEPNSEINKAKGGEPPKPENTQSLQHMDVTEPPLYHDAQEAYFYPFEQALTFYGGIIMVNAPGGTYPFYGTFGLSYLWQSQKAFHFETGLESTGLGEGHVWTTGRWIIHFSNRFRPYYAAGLGLKIRADRALSNAVDITNYFLKGAAGFEYSLLDEISGRAEVGAGYDTLGRYFAGISLGIVIGF